MLVERFKGWEEKASSAADEKSWSRYSLGMGIFSYYLIQGLYGKADEYPTPEGALKDGWVSADHQKY